MFIQTEQTPNPSTLKFLPEDNVLESGTAEFTAPQEAASSPLAQRLFKVNGVDRIFLGKDFISVTKSIDSDWTLLKPMVLAGIMDHYLSGQPVIKAESDAVQPSNTGSDLDSEVIRQIKDVLDTRIRPAVAADGGDVVLDSFEDGILYLSMRGACSGCPSASATLKNGIENMMRHFVPEVLEVRDADNKMPKTGCGTSACGCA
jgi:Fe-S cluster biogenesis protein NfuA